MVTVFIIGLSGCASLSNKKDLEAQGLKNQIAVLEQQLEIKDQEINSLKSALENKAEINAAPIKKIIMPEKKHPLVKHIQMALKNAGYNPGTIDGRMGGQTKDAIKSFQKANNLTPTGKVDKETWKLLQEFLYKKQK